MTCTASDQCHEAGVCDPATGTCSNPESPNGTICGDGDACTQSDSCEAGVCVGANPVTCAALDQCHDAGVCDLETGVCSNPPKADGAACEDSDACTQTDVCQAGECVGGNSVVCTALDQCHEAGVCDPAAGSCSSPPSADGTTCDDGRFCTEGDACQSGVCEGGPTPCPDDGDACTVEECDADLDQCVSDPTVITASVVPSRAATSSGSQITACVHLASCAPAQTVGSYGATLSWDSDVLEFLTFTGGDPPFAGPVVNTSQAATGILRFADSDALGASGNLFLFCAEFQVDGGEGASTALDLELTSLFEAGTFDDLRPLAMTVDSSFMVSAACTVGDVNDEGAINSGDALIILSSEVQLPIPPEIQQRLDAGCGDVNGDGATNSTDAAIVLALEVGLPIPPEFPIGAPNRTFDECPSGSGLVVDPESSGPIILEQHVVGSLVTSSSRVAKDQEFDLTVSIDLGSHRLGSYGAVLRWDPRDVELVTASGGRTSGLESPVFNRGRLASGELRLAHADPRGVEGTVELLRGRFRALRPLARSSTVFSIEYGSLGSPGPRFDDLLPLLKDGRGRSGEKKQHDDKDPR